MASYLQSAVSSRINLGIEGSLQQWRHQLWLIGGIIDTQYVIISRIYRNLNINAAQRK